MRSLGKSSEDAILISKMVDNLMKMVRHYFDTQKQRTVNMPRLPPLLLISTLLLATAYGTSRPPADYSPDVKDFQHREAALYYDGKGEKAKCLASFKAHARFNPEDASAQVDLGVAHLRLGEGTASMAAIKDGVMVRIALWSLASRSPTLSMSTTPLLFHSCLSRWVANARRRCVASHPPCSLSLRIAPPSPPSSPTTP